MSPSQSVNFQDAVMAFHAADFDRAENICHALVAHQPNHAAALHLLGAIAQQRGQLDRAEQFMRRAMAIQNAGFESLHAFANLLAAQGKYVEAVDNYQKAIAQKPDHAVALWGLGNACKMLGDTASAAKAYAQAIGIKPDFIAALNSLGLLFAEQKIWDHAHDCLHTALEHSTAQQLPHTETLNNLAVVCFERKEFAQAQDYATRALQQNPDYVAAWVNLGNTFKAQEKWTDAIHSYGRALKISPSNLQARNNIGLAVLHGLGDCDLAAEHFRHFLAQNPDDVVALTHLGVTHAYRGAFDLALDYYERALDLQPNYHEARNNLANALRAVGRLDEAILAYQYVLAADPDNAELHHNLSLALLQAGRLMAGWRAFEYRWQTPQMAKGLRNFAQAQWQGEEAAGKTLLIHAEQGFGDSLHFCRYASLAAARGLRVIVEAQPELVRLFGSLDGAARVLARGEPLPDFDLHCPMMSLPLAFATTMDSIPSMPVYLNADSAAVAAWHDRLNKMDARLKVGLVWAGNPRRFSVDLAATDRRRSIAPELLTGLLQTKDVRFFSLQKNAEKFPDGEIENYMAECHDFADTAALVSHLDLVISVDTAVAHLAAALGKPVWLLNRADCCWRWLTDRDDSPWYPSLRLFRQTTMGDWAGVLTRVRKELIKTVAEKPQANQRSD